MMPAAKHNDMIMGVDIHIVLVPGTPPVPTPLPHPFVGIVFDPMDYAPIIGSTVRINGKPAGIAGSAGIAMPPHIPLGIKFVKPVGNEAEIFMGSSTVISDGEPLSHTGNQVLTCHCVGMLPPPRVKKKSSSKSFFMPTSTLMCIPAGQPVMVGGPPTISMSAMAMKGAMKGLKGAGKGLKKLNKLKKSSKLIKKASDKMHKAAEAAMEKMKVPKNIRNKVHKGICTVTGHPVDVATGKVFTEAFDFDLPGPIPMIWERTWFSTSEYRGPLGHGWHYSYDIALSFDDKKEAIAMRMSDGRCAVFPFIEDGEDYHNRTEKMSIARSGNDYTITHSDLLQYHFSVNPKAKEEVFPIIRIEDKNGHTIQFLNNRFGKPEQIIDSSGRTIQIDYNEYNYISAIHLPHPGKKGETFPAIKYNYDNQGNLIEVLDAYNRAMTYEYRSHLLVKETDRLGLSFYFEYDVMTSEGKCLRTWGDNGIYDHKISYQDGLTLVENSLGNTTQFYHKDGLVVREVYRGHQ